MSQELQEQEKNSSENEKQSKLKTFTPEEVDSIVLEEVQKIEQQIMMQVTQVRSGPMPSPEELKLYKQVDKNYPTIISDMAQNEQKFRHRSTFLGQFGLPINLGIAAIAGIYAPMVGVAIAGVAGYAYYATRNNNPKPPQAPTMSKS